MPNSRARVSREAKYQYTDKLTGKSLKFSPTSDEVVATFDTASSIDAATALRGMSDSSLYLLSPNRGFAVLKTANASRTADAIAAADSVANTMPVMLDAEKLRRYFVPDEFTIQFKEGVKAEDCEAQLKKMGAAIRKKQRTPGYYTVAVPANAGLFESIEKAAKLPEVLFAEPSEFGINDALGAKAAPAPIAPSIVPDAADGAIEADFIPGDAQFGRLWGLHNTGQVVNNVAGTADCDIDAPEAWDIERGKRHVICAVIDTGMDLDHPDLAANLLPRGAEDWDFADAPDKSPDDAAGHGTHVCGTVAARQDGVGVVGVAPGCYLMPLRVDLTSGMNQNRADAINYVAAQATAFPTRRYVINCSWRMNGDHAGVRNAIINAVNKNVVVVFAAGNANQDTTITPQYPGVYPQVIAVVATDQRDRRATFSNYGANTDISAPGVNIYSTYPDNSYTYLDGTSMASPHVAGVAALVWSRNPDLTNAQVRSILETTAQNIDGLNPGFAGKLGKGRLNAHRALLATPPRKLVSSIVTSYPFPQTNAGSSTGLTFVRALPVGIFGWRPALLFLTQQAGSERIYFLNPNDGSLLSSVDPAANDTIGGLAWDGTHILASNVTVGAGSINRINHTSGVQVSSIPAPPGRGEGLEYYGGRIYYSTINRIYELNPATGAVLRSYPAPEGESRSLVFGRGLLWSGQSTTGRVLAIRPTDLVVQGYVEAPGGGTNQCEGLGFDESTNRLYIANQSENRIYVVQVSGI